MDNLICDTHHLVCKFQEIRIIRTPQDEVSPFLYWEWIYLTIFHLYVQGQIGFMILMNKHVEKVRGVTKSGDDETLLEFFYHSLDNVVA